LARKSAISFPQKPECAGIQLKNIGKGDLRATKMI
jgi:hypothetical protein